MGRRGKQRLSLGKNALGIKTIMEIKNMAYWKSKNASPLSKKMGPHKPFDVDRDIIEKDEQQYPGQGNPSTPDYLYKADGTKVNVANIDEELLKGDKTDSKGKYTLYKDEDGDKTKYYYKKP